MSQLFEVINFTVEGNYIAAAHPEHGLGPCRGQIDNGQPAVSQTHTESCVVPNSLAIGPAVRDLSTHPAKDIRTIGARETC
jgi:hypothetical protein